MWKYQNLLWWCLTSSTDSLHFKSFYFRVSSYLTYRFRAVGLHSLHSPFLFDLYKKAIKPASKVRIKSIEDYRKQIVKNADLLESTDFKTGTTRLITVGSIVTHSLSTPKFSTFLYLLNKYLKAETCLETGTSIGINTCYLAESCDSVITIEGSSAMAAIARKTFSDLKYNSIALKNEDLYKSLEANIVKNKPDVYFLDADHRSTSIAFCIDLILKHTPEVKCIVIHDIYWSRDMAEMWELLIDDPRFVLSIDLFQAGLLFPNLMMEKQHFTIRF